MKLTLEDLKAHRDVYWNRVSPAQLELRVAIQNANDTRDVLVANLNREFHEKHDHNIFKLDRLDLAVSMCEMEDMDPLVAYLRA